MGQNFYENQNYILGETQTSSSRRGLQRTVQSYSNSENFFRNEHDDEELDAFNGYYKFYQNHEKGQNLNRETSLKEIYGTSYSKGANYRSVSRRQTLSSSPPGREGEVVYKNVYKTENTNMATPRQLQSGTYEQIREPPVISTSKPNTRNVETTTCCCCINICCCLNGRNVETDVTQETKSKNTQGHRNSYDSESWDSYDEEYVDRHEMIRNKENVENKRYSRTYVNVNRRQQTKYNPSKRNVAVQMNTQYVLHYNNPKDKTVKPKMRNASCQTITPLFEYLPSRTTKLDINQSRKFEIVPHVRKPPPPEPVGPVVVSRGHRPPSPEDMIRSQPIPRVQEDDLLELKHRPKSYPREQVLKDTANQTRPVTIHVHHQPPQIVLNRVNSVSYGNSWYTLRPATPKGSKVVPFIGDPPDFNEKYETAYFEYKKKKEEKEKNKPPVDNIIIQESEPDRPSSIPVKEPPPEPEIVYYCDPTPEPEPYTPPTPSPPSTPPRIPKKVPKMKSKSNMTRVGGGWMKVEHHRYHHIPLTVYEHPRAFDGKFLYTKSKYTPDKERVPIAYKKYREMVVRNGKLG
ncbi:hypothetical protein KUTeg_007795 [Tegillarca granosa]|uniref:Uncharacterized protein n=1 Tax=Tegillarca granosa TaxID=220873 RepID=A0ABQ9FIY2_TEGGR|nr:hypothetical protein KUTeg_007795 [Tegillarca granosa]